MNGKTDGRKLLTLSRLLPVRLSVREGGHAELGFAIRACGEEGVEAIR